MKVWIAACSLLAVVASEGHASGSVLDAALKGTVMQFMDGGRVSGCGVGLQAIETGVGPNGTAHLFSGAIALLGRNGGIVRGSLATTPGDKLLAGDISSLEEQTLKMVWVKAPGQPATALRPGEEVSKSDTPGVISYVAELAPLATALFAVQFGKPLQIGARTEKANQDVILAGVVAMSDAQRQQLGQCIREFTEYVERSESSK